MNACTLADAASQRDRHGEALQQRAPEEQRDAAYQQPWQRIDAGASEATGMRSV